VAAFDPDVELTRPAESPFVSLFWRGEVLERAIGILVSMGYHVVRVDAAAWDSEPDLHRDLATALDFPDYYGSNLDALNDCLGDVAMQEYGTSPDATGLVLVITGYERFTAAKPGAAQAVLDIFAGQARRAALIGHRMMCLVQSNDPHISFAPVGAMPVMWNDAEWLESSRRPSQR
jgi:hypothetical protein